MSFVKSIPGADFTKLCFTMIAKLNARMTQTAKSNAVAMGCIFDFTKVFFAMDFICDDKNKNLNSERGYRKII